MSDSTFSESLATLSRFFVGDGTYISAFVFDSEHGFTNCVKLRAG